MEKGLSENRNIASHAHKQQNKSILSLSLSLAHTQSLKCPHGCWSCGAINCTVLSERPRPARGDLGKGGGGSGEREKRRKGEEGVLDQLSSQGETPWRA